MTSLFSPLTFNHGPRMKNRFMLAPLTNTQSHADGVLSDDEYRWLTMRAEGGFGLTMTCAAHVQMQGQGFPGQLAVLSDDHIEGLQRLAAGIKANDSIAIAQLHHAGMRSPAELINTAPLSASDVEKFGARGMSHEQVREMVDAFVEAGVRAQRAGFDGVEVHGAHGYVLGQFLSAEVNQRDDEYGGSLENRARVIFEIVEGLRDRCGDDFMIGVRLSPERFGMQLAEVISVAQRLCNEGKIDFLDMSLWDVFKEPEEEDFKGQSLLKYFTDIDRGNVRLGVAGKIMTPADAQAVLDAGVDWVMLGRAAILHHDFPNRMAEDAAFTPVSVPVTADYLRNEGLSDKFVTYMSGWKGFIEG